MMPMHYYKNLINLGIELFSTSIVNCSRIEIVINTYVKKISMETGNVDQQVLFLFQF